MCFEISNFEEVYAHDVFSLEKTKRALTAVGALPAKIDWPSRTFCVVVTHPLEPSAEQILEVFSKFGYKAQFRDE